MGCGTCVSAGHEIFTGKRLQMLQSVGLRPVAATERGCTDLCHAELYAALQLCCTKLWAGGMRAEALNLIGMVIRITSGRWD